MPKNLPISLLIMRLVVGAFFMVWALEKIIAPNVSAKLAKGFYGLTLDTNTLMIIGAIQVVLILAFMAGFMKTITYGTLTVVHTISVATTWGKMMTPYMPPNTLFFAGIPIIALMVALFLLRDSDTMCTIGAKQE